MAAGADSIDDCDVLRSGATDRLFTGIRAPSTLGTFLRGFDIGHATALESPATQVLSRLADQTGTRLLPQRHLLPPASPPRRPRLRHQRTEDWTPISYAAPILDEDTGTWIRTAQVAETGYTAFTWAHPRGPHPQPAARPRRPGQPCPRPARTGTIRRQLIAVPAQPVPYEVGLPDIHRVPCPAIDARLLAGLGGEVVPHDVDLTVHHG
jgi:hypothetical protein